MHVHMQRHSNPHWEGYLARVRDHHDETVERIDHRLYVRPSCYIKNARLLSLPAAVLPA